MVFYSTFFFLSFLLLFLLKLVSLVIRIKEAGGIALLSCRRSEWQQCFQAFRKRPGLIKNKENGKLVAWGFNWDNGFPRCFISIISWMCSLSPLFVLPFMPAQFSWNHAEVQFHNQSGLPTSARCFFLSREENWGKFVWQRYLFNSFIWFNSVSCFIASCPVV